MIGYGISGTTHDFFAYNAAGEVWNGSAFVAWNNANYASYRITATETGSTGRFTGTSPSGADTYELRERGASLAESYVVWAGDFVAVEIGKVPRSATAVAAGGDYAWNAVLDTANKLTINITTEE